MKGLDRRELLARGGALALVAGLAGAVPEWAFAARPTKQQLRQLQRQIRGSVVTPGEHGYNQAHVVVNTRYDDVHPAAIVFCASAGDVQKTVKWARQHHVHIVPRWEGVPLGRHAAGGMADPEELKALARPRLQRLLQHGVTTVEVKSGYGLTVADEIKCLEGIAELNAEGPLELVPTFLGAHAVPPEYRSDRAGYLLTQNKIRFVLTTALQPDHPIAEHVRLHGDGVRDIALWVDDAESAWRETTKRGARTAKRPAR